MYRYHGNTSDFSLAFFLSSLVLLDKVHELIVGHVLVFIFVTLFPGFIDRIMGDIAIGMSISSFELFESHSFWTGKLLPVVISTHLFLLLLFIFLHELHEFIIAEFLVSVLITLRPSLSNLFLGNS